jgi:phosphoribosylaminoimidazole carboxylase PurE protein
VVSAHRTPARACELASTAQQRGVKCIIAAAGKAAHLAGVLAAHTTVPMIGVPMTTSDLGGMDSLLSMVQMPRGVPVATVAIGKTGAVNAALLAVSILALADEALSGKLQAYRQEMAEAVEKDDEEIRGR